MKYAWVLLTVYLSIVLVSSLHIHPASLWQIDECEQCVNHTPHAGHLTASDGWSHDCLLCQFLSFSYVAAAVATVILYNQTFKLSYHAPLARIGLLNGGTAALRAPPSED